MKLLRPIILTPRYWEHIEKSILKVFIDLIYKPLFKDINESQGVKLEYANAKDALAEAIRKGTVDYDNGKFTGNFTAAITKQIKEMGGTYNATQKAFYVPRGNVPPSVSLAKAHADDVFTRLRKSVLKTLDDSTIDSIFAHTFHWNYLQEQYEQAIEWMDGDFKKTVKSITIAPDLTPEQKKIIAKEWTNNLKLYIRGWTKENIVDLRDKIQKNAFAGQRSSGMIKLIQDNYGVGVNKAKFLARQETSLLMSKFRETRYADIGITQYKWSTSGDARVRDDHKHLDGKIFRFDDPPLANKSQRGKKMYCNPGEDFNCRCIARPVWD